jgi:hypothetical protein
MENQKIDLATNKQLDEIGNYFADTYGAGPGPVEAYAFNYFQRGALWGIQRREQEQSQEHAILISGITFALGIILTKHGPDATEAQVLAYTLKKAGAHLPHTIVDIVATPELD